MFRTVNDQPTLWDSILPPELLVLPAELGRVDALLDDPVFFAPFAAYFDARIGRPSIPMETYLRLMFLKFRYRLGYESLCREVADSISWQRFCRIPFGTRVPHPTTLMKITTRCGDDAVAGLNEALLAKAAAAKLLRTDKVRADTTVVEAAVAYPTDSGLLAKAIGTMARTVARIKAAGGATRTRARIGAARRVGGPARSPPSCGCAVQQQRDQAQAAVRRITGELAGIAEAAMREATAVMRNAKRALRTATGQRKGRLHRAINDLDTIVGRTERVVAQTRSRLAGVMPESAHPAGQPARCRRPPDPQRTPGQAGRVRLQSPDRRQRRRGHPRPQRRDRQPRRRPATGPGDRTDHPPHRTHATRGHRRPRLRRSIGGTRPARPRRAQRGDPPQEQTQRRAPRVRTPASLPRQGQMADRIRRTDQPHQTKLRLEPHRTHRHHGARTWCGHGFFAHNLVKIATSQHETHHRQPNRTDHRPSTLTPATTPTCFSGRSS